MILRELFLVENKQPDLLQILTDFLPVVMKELKISKLPKIKLRQHLPKDEQPTFGKFVNDENTIYLGVVDRHPLDILRTLAHELVHFNQHQQGKMGAHSGDTGSPIENEAHAVAGVIMRHFNKQFPKYFDHKAVEIDQGETHEF